MALPLFAMTAYLATLGMLLAKPRQHGLAQALLLLALVAHLMALLAFNSLRLGGALSWVSFTMALLSAPGLLLSRLRILSLISLPIAALGTALLLGEAQPSRQLAWTIELHAAVALAAYAALSLAAALALLLLYQERMLRRHHAPPSWLQLPALASTERLHFGWLAGGFALLSLTLLSGALFVHDWFAQHLVHKTILTVAAWMVFAALLIGHHRRGWRGAQAARWTLAGMALLLLAFFGSKLVLEVILRRGAGE